MFKWKWFFLLILKDFCFHLLHNKSFFSIILFTKHQKAFNNEYISYDIVPEIS